MSKIVMLFSLACIMFLVFIVMIVVWPCGEERDDVVKAPLPNGLHLEYLSERIMQLKHHCDSLWILPIGLVVSYFFILLQYWCTRNAWYVYNNVRDDRHNQDVYKSTLVASGVGLVFVVLFDHTSELVSLHYIGVFILIATLIAINWERDEHFTEEDHTVYHALFITFVASAILFGILVVTDLEVGAVYLEYILLLDIFVASIVNLSELRRLTIQRADALVPVAVEVCTPVQKSITVRGSPCI